MCTDARSQAPEQFRGQAQPASDLYGLGGVLLYLLTGTAPSEFPQSGLRIDFEASVAMSGRMRRVRGCCSFSLPVVCHYNVHESIATASPLQSCSLLCL